MALSAAIQQDIETRLALTINRANRVSGGDINAAYCLDTTAGKMFVKVNSRTAFPQMFKREQEGLEALAAADAIGIPNVIMQGDTGDESYLVLEWITIGNITPKASQLLGEQLAVLHRTTQPHFGFENDNYMGSLGQMNEECSSFAEFFVSQRLYPMVAMAIYNGKLPLWDGPRFEELYRKIPSLTPPDPPALVHGDLWAGNYMIDTNGKPYLIDPAVAYSNREADIALTTLFGGFGREFYQAYQAAWPMESGWQERLQLWNLYPLLVHVNLFGGGYAEQVRAVLGRFVG